MTNKDDDRPPSGRDVASGALFLSRGGVTIIKSLGTADPTATIVEVARRLDALPSTRLLSPVRLTVPGTDGRRAFDETWSAPPSVGTLDLVRRGYVALGSIRVQGRLAPPIRLLVEGIADLVLGGASSGRQTT